MITAIQSKHGHGPVTAETCRGSYGEDPAGNADGNREDVVHERADAATSDGVVPRFSG